VLKLLIFMLTCKCNSFLHSGVETGDEAHPSQWDLSDQGASPLGGGGVQLVGEGSGGLGLSLQLLGARQVQSCVRAELGE
jgi:hypothetical protein